MWTIGTKFRHNSQSRDVLFTIEAGKEPNTRLVSWHGGKSSVEYGVNEISRFFEQGVWIIEPSTFKQDFKVGTHLGDYNMPKVTELPCYANGQGKLGHYKGSTYNLSEYLERPIQEISPTHIKIDFQEGWFSIAAIEEALEKEAKVAAETAIPATPPTPAPAPASTIPIIGYTIKDEKYLLAAALITERNGRRVTEHWNNNRRELGYMFTSKSINRREIETAGVLDLWFTPVYQQLYNAGDYVIAKPNISTQTLKEGEDYLGVVRAYNPGGPHPYEVDYRLSNGHPCLCSTVSRLATSQEVKLARGLQYKVGDYLYCIKDVVMECDGTVEFTTGNVYLCEVEECLTNNSGNTVHIINHDEFSKEHFRMATPEEIEAYRKSKIPKKPTYLTYKEGDYLYCTKDFVMAHDPKDIRYSAGKVYKSQIEGCITDNTGLREHYMSNGKENAEYFRMATPEEIATMPVMRTLVLGSKGDEIQLHEGYAIVDGSQYKLERIQAIYNYFTKEFPLSAYGVSADRKMQFIRIGCEGEDHRFSLDELRQIIEGIR